MEMLKALGKGMIYCTVLFGTLGGLWVAFFYSANQVAHYDNYIPMSIFGVVLFLFISFLMSITMPKENDN